MSNQLKLRKTEREQISMFASYEVFSNFKKLVISKRRKIDFRKILPRFNHERFILFKTEMTLSCLCSDEDVSNFGE